MYNVGDIIKAPTWENCYEVIKVVCNNCYDIQNMDSGYIVRVFYLDYIPENIVKEGKPLSVIERKIALMERRFQKKQQEKKHVAS